MLTNRCRALADLLDAQEATYEAKLDEMYNQINDHLTSINNLNNENRSKSVVYNHFAEGLRFIQKRKHYIHIDIYFYKELQRIGCCFYPNQKSVNCLLQCKM